MSMTMLPIKRCKNCVWWQVFNGNIQNEVMRKLHGELRAPNTKQHACTLVLRGKDDEVVPVKHDHVVSTDYTGPRYGERIGPNGSCEHVTLKRRPWRRPAPISEAAAIMEPPTAPDPFTPEAMEHPPSGELTPIVSV